MKSVLKELQLGTAVLATVAMLAGVSRLSTAFAQAASPPAAASVALSEPTIKALQEALNKQGIAVKTDGVLNAETRAAIRRYQSQHHLPVSGEPDKATLDKLGVAARQSAAPASPSTVGQAAPPATSTAPSQSPTPPGPSPSGSMMSGPMMSGPMMSGPMMQGMMQGMMQMMQGIMGMMQAQVQPAPMQLGPMQPGRMQPSPMQPPQTPSSAVMNCPMMPAAAQASAPAMMQMMQGMMQMMQMMQGPMQPSPMQPGQMQPGPMPGPMQPGAR